MNEIHAHWEKSYDYTHYCSNCGCDALIRNSSSNYSIVDEYLTDYCPNCGAQMAEEDIMDYTILIDPDKDFSFYNCKIFYDGMYKIPVSGSKQDLINILGVLQRNLHCPDVDLYDIIFNMISELMINILDWDCKETLCIERGNYSIDIAVDGSEED